ncbi:MAG: GGDEF domain-containing protein [Gammaproteobacteria bacterium]
MNFTNNKQTPAHEAQLSRGFRGLRFSRELETEFRQDWVARGVFQLRISLVLGFVFGIALMLLDYFLGARGLSDPSILHRSWINQSLLLSMFAATFFRSCRPYLQYMGTAVCLGIVAASEFIGNISSLRDVGSPSMGHLVVTFYAYLFIGLRFWPAIGAATSIFAIVITGAILSNTPMASLLYSGLFLLFANMIGSTGLYNLEYNRRKSFLEAKELMKLAGSDPLTGLPNRSTLTTHLGRVWQHCKRTGETLTLAMLDVDQFKKYNDRYGHQAGDQCLQRVADVIGNVPRRPFDLAARYGGEEFVLLLPNCTVAHARERLRNLCHDIEDLEIRHEASQVAPVVTVSAGLAQVSPLETERSAEGLLQMADEALYLAKQQGRNRVVVTAEDDSLQTGFFRYKDLAPVA